MRLPALLTADLHYTSNDRDEYRWALWPWLRDTIVDEKVNSLVIAGDLSDAKDFHPSPLVNRLAREIKLTAECRAGLRVYMIPGNHEWIKQGEEFWRFLGLIAPNVHYMIHPQDDPVLTDKDEPTAYFLPFTRTPERDWQGMNFEDYDYVFMHQTLRGAVASNGQKMEGEAIPEDVLATARKVYSGDIHVPQHVGWVEYIGSPYHVHFGDNFKPRCVLIEKGGNAVDLHFKSPRRVMLDVNALAEARDIWAKGVKPGDQVKLRVHLPASEVHTWKNLRREVLAVFKAAGGEVHGIELIPDGAGMRRSVSISTTAPGVKRSVSEDVLRFVVHEELGPEAFDTAMEVIEWTA